MALAAVKSGFPIHRSEMDGLDFFDDRIEKIRISKGQSTPEARAQYFSQQSGIEQVEQNLFQRLSGSVAMRSSFLYNRIRVQLASKMFPSTLVDYPKLNSNY
jgi:metal-dependent HD superfamily phosphatase/phosphodiesterase